ncbi:MAG: excinuclease ABC subunit UvrC [Planctomycetota bacterium]
MDPLEVKLADLPHASGCYVFKDAAGTEIYVGKAINLRRRVSSYFQRHAGHPAKTLRLVQEVADLDVYVVDSEVEALLLENQLIKELQPRFNVRLKDDKNYPLLAVTREPFPRVFITRDRKLEKVQYYGPFGSATGLHRAYHFLQRVFQFRVCTLTIDPADKRRRYARPCLNFHIKRCSAPCTTRIDEERYGEDIKALKAFLSGRGKRAVLGSLRERMAEAAAAMRYEDAARFRDQIRAIDRLKERGKLRDYDAPGAPVFDNEAGMASLEHQLGLERPPRTVEAFDIAHLQGDHVVAAMVQFIDGVPHRDGYRRFRIRGTGDDPGNDDFAAMREVVGRRYRRLRDEGHPLPDLVLIDGGLGQVRMAAAVMAEEQVAGPVLLGLAKREETLVRPDGEEIRLPKRDPGLKLLMYARDEAHRFSRRYFHLLQHKSLAAGVD